MLTYNTHLKKLVLPEYGRIIQKMVNHCLTIENREERNLCAQTLINAMGNLFPALKEGDENQRKLWDHLAIMSDFKLDIDYPVDISKAKSMEQKPQPIGYSKGNNPVKHYGSLVFQLFERLKTMPAGKERDALTKLTANQMKRNLIQWSHGSNDDEKIISDLARFTDGIIQLDLDKFKFDVSVAKEPVDKKKKKR